MENRMEDLRCLYGETVTVADAARIIGMSRNTMYALLKRGKISRACGGKRIDVRSVARYPKGTLAVIGMMTAKTTGVIALTTIMTVAPIRTMTVVAMKTTAGIASITAAMLTGIERADGTKTTTSLLQSRLPRNGLPA